MPHHVWSVICAKSSIDRTANTVSLFDVVEQINVQIPPENVAQPGLISFSFELVSLWTRRHADAPERATGRVIHIDADNSQSNAVEIAIDLTTHRRLRSTIQSSALRVIRPGIHQFGVEVQEGVEAPWTTVASIPIEIIFTVSEPAPDPGAATELH
jgi:hypothetical protein